jgi:Domain of unknown function (DUF5615)
LTEIRFYLDENVNVEIAVQLRKHGIDVVTVRDLELLGDEDPNHLQLATELGRVLCTHDQDFPRMSAKGIAHSGIGFAQQYGATIGGWVKALRNLHATKTAEEMKGQIVFLSVK